MYSWGFTECTGRKGRPITGPLQSTTHILLTVLINTSISCPLSFTLSVLPCDTNTDSHIQSSFNQCGHCQPHRTLAYIYWYNSGRVTLRFVIDKDYEMPISSHRNVLNNALRIKLLYCKNVTKTLFSQELSLLSIGNVHGSLTARIADTANGTRIAHDIPSYNRLCMNLPLL